jgi:hypothetical protein
MTNALITHIIGKAEAVHQGVKKTIQPLLDEENKASLTLAKREINVGQKELRALKKELLDSQRQTRQKFQERNAAISGAGQTVGAFVGSKARGHMARARQGARRSLTEEKIAVMSEYDNAKAQIDRMIMAWDRAKAMIDKEMTKMANGAGEEVSPIEDAQTTTYQYKEEAEVEVEDDLDPDYPDTSYDDPDYPDTSYDDTKQIAQVAKAQPITEEKSYDVSLWKGVLWISALLFLLMILF